MPSSESWTNILWALGAAAITGFLVWYIRENWTEAQKQLLTNKIGRALIYAAQE